MDQGLITVDHADTLYRLADHVDGAEFTSALPDLLAAAVGVELAVFVDRVRVWQWRVQPDTTDEDVDAAFERRSVTMQRDFFGGMKGAFQFGPAAAAVVADGLFATPDRLDSLEGPRSLAQRTAEERHMCR